MEEDIVMFLEEKPFQNPEDVKHEVKLCSTVATVFQVLSLLFAVVGIIGDVLNTTLGLETLSWFLLAIILGISSVLPSMHAVLAKHLLYMDETEKEQ
jgi:membrane protein YqaA with SNARE-associated domain